jgi:hypothetical protein
MGDMRNAYKILAGKPEEMRTRKGQGVDGKFILEIVKSQQVSRFC